MNKTAECRDHDTPMTTCCLEQTMTLPDGAELFYRVWLPDHDTGKSLVLFHRGHEHSGRLSDVVEQLGLDDVTVFAWDARGHGHSSGERGYAPSFAGLVADMDAFIGHVAEAHHKSLEKMVVLGHSVGAVMAATWVHDYAPAIRALVLVTPALRVKLYVPLAIPGLRALKWLRGERKTFITSYVRPRMLTHDAEQAERYSSDPLITRAIAVNILLGLYDASTRLIEDAGAIRVPTLVLSSGSDWVVRVGPQRRLFERLGTSFKKVRLFEGMYHDVLHEKDRHSVIDEIRTFIGDAFAGEPRSSNTETHEDAYTQAEYERLARPLPFFSPRRLGFAVQRCALKTLGQLSDGIRLGWRTGFDSGQSLDYVYENHPRGRLLVGKWFDRMYLNSIGWKGIRVRKTNLEDALAEVIERLRSAGKAAHVVDIATGCGRYLLEVLAERPDVTALLRDNTQANLEAGRALAEQLHVKQATFELGDAFDEHSLATLQPPPNIAIVSGLYELFPDNRRVLGSLHGLSQAMARGGYLIYTGQPWHPQLEMIARVLVNRDKAPWLMRRRTQWELDRLVREAGFSKIGMKIDDYGIFTVSIAKIGD